MPLVRPSRRRSAFTLIEVLAAMAVVVILVGISVRVIQSSKQRTSMALARAQLAGLTQALENYKQHYGDYPQTGSAPQAAVIPTADITVTQAQALLFNALIGVYAPTDFNTQRNGPVLVELSKFRIEETGDYRNRASTNSVAVPTGSPPIKQRIASAFLDPWGNRYLYYYRAAPVAGGSASNVWRLPGYVLYSAGPDGRDTPPDRTTGLFTGTTQTTGLNADNVWATP